jgi:hypothetical protein
MPAKGWMMTTRPPYPGRLSGHYLNHTRLAAAERRAGRVISMSFASLQRIGKGATIDVWFPKEQRAAISASNIQRIAPLQWAAVRQVELLQEAPNIAVEDMDVTRLYRSLFYLEKMSARGYRLVIAVAGHYVDCDKTDELVLFDTTLQDRLQQIVNMLWLDEISRALSTKMTDLMTQQQWNFQQLLPHVGMTLGAMDLFDRPKAYAAGGAPLKLKAQLAKLFIDNMAQLATARAIDHDVTVGLKLPELQGNHHWVYVPDGEATIHAFNSMLTDVFSKFDHINLRGLDGDGFSATRETKASTQHLGGYRHRLKPESEAHFRSLADYSLGSR